MCINSDCQLLILLDLTFSHLFTHICKNMHICADRYAHTQAASLLYSQLSECQLFYVDRNLKWSHRFQGNCAFQDGVALKGKLTRKCRGVSVLVAKVDGIKLPCLDPPAEVLLQIDDRKN